MSNSFDVISKGLLPFLGGMRRFIPFLFEAAGEVVHPDKWQDWTYHDMTCGSCAGSAAFGFYGMSTTANDLAMRSYIPAKVIFGTTTSHPGLIRQALEGDASVPPVIKPARDLIPDKLHPLAADIFDKLFYAGWRYSLSEAHDDYLRYLAIRWVLLNKNYMYFLKLPTMDLVQLAVQGDPWKKVVNVILEPLAALLKVAKDIDHLIHAQLSAKHQVPSLIQRGDCRQNIKNIDFSRPSFIGLNPPTAGNSTFMQSNAVLDTLLFNEKQAFDDGDMPGDLWRSLILDTVKHVPSGHYVFSFVGDGAVSWEDGKEQVFAEVGPTIKEWSFPWHNSSERNAGLILLKVK